MLRNRLTYLFILLAVFLFFLCFNGYLSLYVLLVALAFPFISLLLSLPGILGIRMELALSKPTAQKEEAISLRLSVRTRSPLPSGRGKILLSVRNTLTGEAQEESFTFTAGSKPLTVVHQLSSSSCGQVVCRLLKGKICDYLGIFSFPLPIPKEAQCRAVFFPAVYHPFLSSTPVVMPGGEGDSYSKTRPGDDPSELFDLREYREGDRLSRINWKLSRKTGKTLVKELSLPVSDHIFFLLDVNSSGRDADTLLDTFATLSAYLSEQELAHRVGFRKEKTNLTLREILGPEDFQPVLQELLLAGSQPFSWPLPDREFPTGVAHALYLCCTLNQDILYRLWQQMPSARLTVLMAGEEPPSQPKLPAGAELIIVPPGHTSDALTGFSL